MVKKAGGPEFWEAVEKIEEYYKRLAEAKSAQDDCLRLRNEVAELCEKEALNKSQLATAARANRDTIYQWVIRYREQEKLRKAAEANEDTPEEIESRKIRPVYSSTTRKSNRNMG